MMMNKRVNTIAVVLAFGKSKAMTRVNANVFRQALLLGSLIVLPSVVLAAAGHDAKKEPAAMEGMDHGGVQGRTSGTAAAHWMAPEDAVKQKNPVAASAASVARGTKLFQANCASCHGAQGRGDGPVSKTLSIKPADLASMAGQHPDGNFAWKIANGRGLMPAWKGTLSETQIWDTVNFIQSLAAANGRSKKSGEMGAMPGMDHGGAAPKKAGDMGNMKQGEGGMDHGSMSMQGGKAPPDARDPHAYSNGYDFGPLKLRMADQENFSSLLVDNLEAMRTKDNTSAEYDLQAWYGRIYNRAVLKAEGEVDDGRSAESRTELLWGHAVAIFWDTQLGMRRDGGQGPNRSWLAFGVQGIAPYWFNVDIAAYLGEEGRSALRLDAEYDLLLTQKLILLPRIDMNFYGKADAARGLGSGLSDASVALRLRYEIRREFAPYIGIERVAKFGGTADYARAAGKDAEETRFIAGVRFWY